MSTCNGLDLQTLGSQLVVMQQESPRSLVHTLGGSDPGEFCFGITGVQVQPVRASAMQLGKAHSKPRPILLKIAQNLEGVHQILLKNGKILPHSL